MACAVRMSGGGGDCVVMLGCDMEVTLCGGVVALLLLVCVVMV